MSVKANLLHFIRRFVLRFLFFFTLSLALSVLSLPGTHAVECQANPSVSYLHSFLGDLLFFSFCTQLFNACFTLRDLGRLLTGRPVMSREK